MSKEFNWTQFFREAGIPLSIAKRYSVTFDDNRISQDMLMDLNKEILTSMGITAMGDVINILKQAKKTHSQDMKRKDSTASKTVVVSNKRPPPPTAHSTTPGHVPTVSTTPGHASAVSTTSTSTKKKIVAKYAKNEVPDTLSPELSAPPLDQEVTYVGYILEPKKDAVPHTSRLKQRSLGLPSSVEDQQEEEIYMETSLPVDGHRDTTRGSDFQESYETSRYEASKAKKPMTMYSDEYPQTRESPRVIILPGEGQDIFTTSGLQKAAKVYETGEEQEGKLTTDRSRRLLESAGLIPVAKDKSSSSSIFSRLDYKPSVITPPSTTLTRLSPISTSPSSSSTVPKSRRIIKLSKNSPTTSSPSNQLTRTVINTTTQRKVASLTPTSKSVTRVKATSSSPRLLVKRLVSAREEPKPSAKRLKEDTRSVTERLGIRKRTVSNPVSARRDIKDSNSLITSTVKSSSKVRFADSASAKRSGVFGYKGEEDRGRVSAESAGVKVQSSMVADEYEYQSQRQRDIRTRLEVKESQKRARRGGPLVGRLAMHKVFGRLE